MIGSTSPGLGTPRGKESAHDAPITPLGDRGAGCSGDVIWTPPGVTHWHGATATNAMSHLAVWEFVNGSGGELMEHVSDEDYLTE